MLKRIKIGDLIKQKKAHSQTGPFGTQLKASDYVEDGTPVINVRNIGFGDIRSDSLEYVNDDMAKELKNHKLRKNDIVFGRKGAVERHSLISSNEDGWIQGSDCIRLRFLTNEYDPTFISYFFLTEYHKQWMMNLGSFGATMSSLNQEIISKIEIPDISLPTQRKIASILSAYDELIENNKQRIRLLEEMAEEIYKEWFVRMRFPGHETAKFVDGLPEGWENVKLESVCDFQMGQSPLSEFYNDEGKGLPFHQGVTNFNSRFPEHTTYCTDLKRIADEGDILLSVRAPVGRINIATCKLIIGRGLSSVKHKKQLPNYCYYLLKNIFIKEDSYGNGSVFNSVTKNDLLGIKTIEPSFKLCVKFQDLIKPVDDEIKILTDKNQLLQQTRDLLLPRLISGKLSVGHLVEDES